MWRFCVGKIGGFSENLRKTWRSPVFGREARLDNFAIQLQNAPDHRAYLVVYAGRQAVVAEAQLRGNRARDYLVNVREIESSRVTVIDGGHHEDLAVQLWFLPPGINPPEPYPTVKAEDAEVIYEKPKRRRQRN